MGVPDSATVIATNQLGESAQTTFNVTVQGVAAQNIQRLGDVFSADGTAAGVTPAIAPESYDTAVGNITNNLAGIMVQTVYSNTSGATPVGAAAAVLDAELTSGSSLVYFELGYGAVKAGATEGFGSGLSIEYGTDTLNNSGAAGSVYVAIMQASDVVQSGSPSISYLAEQISGTEGISIGVGNLNNSPTQSAEQVTLIRADQLVNTAPDNLISTLEAQPGLIEKVFVEVVPVASLSVSSLNFGNEAIGQPETMHVTVTNNGTAAMDITGFSAPAGYTVVPDGAGTFGNVDIAAGGSQLFDVTFTPGAGGLYNGNLVFTDNDSTASDSTLALTGESDFVTVVGAGIPAQAANVGEPFIILASQYFNEPIAGDNLTYSLQGQPSWMQINSVTGAITGVPSYIDQGVSESATVIATNQYGVTAQSTFSLTIQPPSLNILGDVFYLDGTGPGTTPSFGGISYDNALSSADLSNIYVATEYTNTSPGTITSAQQSAIQTIIGTNNPSNVYLELSYGLLLPNQSNELILNPNDFVSALVPGPTLSYIYGANASPYIGVTESTPPATGLEVADGNGNNPLFGQTSAEEVVLVRYDALSAAGQALILQQNPGVIEHIFVVAVPEASVSVSALNFNNLAIGQTETISVTVTNNGASPLDITGISSLPAGYSVVTHGSTSFLPENLAALGGAETFDVTFTPTTSGANNGNIVFADNDTNLADSTVAITGESDLVTVIGAGILAQTAAVGVPIDILAAKVFDEPVSGDALHYALQGQPSWMNINSTTGEITGTPGTIDVGAHESATVIATNQYGVIAQSTFNLNVENSAALVPEAAVASTLNFGDVASGNTETLSVTITNEGTGNLDITGISNLPAGYSVVTHGDATIVPESLALGLSETFDVTFTPTATGTYADNLVFADNDPIAADSTVALSGVNDFPVATAIPQELATVNTPIVDINAANYITDPIAGDVLTYSLAAGAPSWMTITDGIIGGTPLAADQGMLESATIIATNQAGGTVQDQFNVDVLGPSESLGAAFTVDATLIAPELSYDGLGGTGLDGVTVRESYSNTSATPYDLSYLSGILTDPNQSTDTQTYLELGLGGQAALGNPSSFNLIYGTDVVFNAQNPSSGQVELASLVRVEEDMVTFTSTSDIYTLYSSNTTQLSGSNLAAGAILPINAGEALYTPNNVYYLSTESNVLIRVDQLTATGVTKILADLGIIEHVFVVHA